MGEPISHTTTVMRGSLPSGLTRHDSLNFAVDVRHQAAPEPESIWQVMGRQKDIQLASRAGSHIARQKQIHRLRHVIRELMQHLPAAWRLGALRAAAFELVALLEDGGHAVNRPRRCIATSAGDSMSIQVRKSIVLNSRSMAGGPHTAAPRAR